MNVEKIYLTDLYTIASYYTQRVIRQDFNNFCVIFNFFVIYSFVSIFLSSWLKRENGLYGAQSGDFSVYI